MYNFLKRNPEISLRKPEVTSVNRINGFNRQEVERFISNLEIVQKHYNFTPARILNVDQTGITTVQTPANIYGSKGQKQVGVLVSWERGETVTICCAFSASKTFIPPMFICPRQRMSTLLQKCEPPNALYACSKTGWMTQDLFVMWLEYVVKFTKPSEKDPVLLIMDNHCISHSSLTSYNFCRDNYVVVVSMPPHMSQKLQPLDVTFYGPLKIAFNRELDLYIRNYSNEKVTPYELSSYLTRPIAVWQQWKKLLKVFKLREFVH